MLFNLYDTERRLPVNGFEWPINPLRNLRLKGIIGVSISPGGLNFFVEKRDAET